VTRETDLDRIRQAFTSLEIHTLRENAEGLVNRVLIVNEERVFRFPRADWARESQARELRVLDLVASRLDLRIPSVDYRSPDLISYALIPGVPLTRNRLIRMAPTSRVAVIRDLATFLSQLHSTPLPSDIHASEAQRTREQHLATYQQVQSDLFPLLMADQIEWVEDLYRPLVEDTGFLDHQPALINGDLGCYHLLCDPETDALSGIIDFGTAGKGDPAGDIGMMINQYGESMVRQLSWTYEFVPDLIERARFYAAQVELFWMLRGLQTGDKSWFAVHLSRAGDALPVGSGWPDE